MTTRRLFARTCRECRRPVGKGWARSDEYRASGWCPDCLGLEDHLPAALLADDDLASPATVRRVGDDVRLECWVDGCTWRTTISAQDDVTTQVIARRRAHHYLVHRPLEPGTGPETDEPDPGDTDAHRVSYGPGWAPITGKVGATLHIVPRHSPNNTHSGEPMHHQPTHRTQVRIHQPAEFFPADLVGLMVTDPDPGTGRQQFLRYRQGETVPTLEWETAPDSPAYPGDWSAYPALTVLPERLLPQVRDAITAHLGDDGGKDLADAQETIRALDAELADTRTLVTEARAEGAQAVAREKDAHLATQDRHLDTMRAYIAAVEAYAMPQRFVAGTEGLVLAQADLDPEDARQATRTGDARSLADALGVDLENVTAEDWDGLLADVRALRRLVNAAAQEGEAKGDTPE